MDGDSGLLLGGVPLAGNVVKETLDEVTHFK